MFNLIRKISFLFSVYQSVESADFFSLGKGKGEYFPDLGFFGLRSSII